MIETIVQNFVRNECGKSENVFSNSFFMEHLVVVADYSVKLCGILNGDEEIVRISSYLHDISAVQDIRTLPAHNLKSAEVAAQFLSANNYPKEKIDKVTKCITRHVSPLKQGDGTVEEVALSNADAISQIVNPSFWLYFVYKVRNVGYDEGNAWYINRITENWNKLIDPAKMLTEDKYRKVLAALS